MLDILTGVVSEPRNPGGNIGLGATLKKNGEEIFQHSKFIPEHPHNTNNVGEYMAFESILDFIFNHKIENEKVTIYGDSKLVIEQMNGRWRIKFGRYTPYADRCKRKLKELRENNKLSFNLNWIPREQNGYADRLSKGQLIEHGVEFKIQPNEKEEVPLSEINPAFSNILPSYTRINDIR